MCTTISEALQHRRAATWPNPLLLCDTFLPPEAREYSLTSSHSTGGEGTHETIAAAELRKVKDCAVWRVVVATHPHLLLLKNNNKDTRLKVPSLAILIDASEKTMEEERKRA